MPLPVVPLGAVVDVEPELMLPAVDEPEAGGVEEVIEPFAPAAPVVPLVAPAAPVAADESGVVADAGALADEVSAAEVSAFFLAQAPRANRLTPARASAIFEIDFMEKISFARVGKPQNPR